MTNTVLPLQYTFIGAQGELTVFFSTVHPKPDEDRSESTYTNKRDILFGSDRPGRKLPSNSTHYLTVECSARCSLYLSFNHDVANTAAARKQKPQLISMSTKLVREREIFQKEPGESLSKMISRVTNSTDFEQQDTQLKKYAQLE